MTDKKIAQWDAGRFIKTLAYFRVIPFIGSINWLQQLLGIVSHRQPDNPGLILVAGATGGVGKRVVRKLQQQGYQVRALVRDAKRAQELLGKTVELVEGDITIPETLTPQVTDGIEAVICCTGTRVQPKEGDTPTREKYYQGIKFYMPEVVDIPEVVEYQGLQNLVKATRNSLTKNSEKTIFDFAKPTPELKEAWGTLDDVVMGGVSESSIQVMDRTALFSGNVSTANSGGFASVRTRNFDFPLNLSDYHSFELRIKGDGKRYKFLVRNDTKWDSIAYCYSFDTVYNTWMTVQIPFRDLIPVFRAKTVNNAEPFNASCITSLQLMLSKFEYDGALNPRFEAGFFQLELESIKAVSEQKLPRFILVSSAGVTRPGRPGLDLEKQPPAVRMNDQLGGILTWKLKGEDCLRASRIPYTIVRPCALTEEPGGQSLVFDRGDTIVGKVSREDLAEVCVQLLKEPNACQMTFEVKEAENSQFPQKIGDLLAKLSTDP